MDAGTLAVDFVILLVLLGGISRFRTPRGARLGNALAALALLAAGVATLLRGELHATGLVVGTAAIGAALGLWLAARVTMLQIPAMVAFQHGAGGLAAVLVAVVEIARLGGDATVVARASGLLGVIIGGATFSASLIASGKLASVLSGRPLRLPRHGTLLVALVAFAAAMAIFVGIDPTRHLALGVGTLAVLAVALGWLVAVRVGGADMPVLISFLNATAGVAASFCGVLAGSRLLVACGATVAASGTVLTVIMCRSMNRSLWNVFVGLQPAAAGGGVWLPEPSSPTAEATAPAPTPAGTDAPPAAPATPADPFAAAVDAARGAQAIVIVPGYGMAVGQAQFEVVGLARQLAAQGKRVKFAIHPVAGRMPGHMNVLLAEADASYDDLVEMEDANPMFPETDLALVVGACDVVNPAAVETRDTPISGMPILNVHEARHVVVCNLDERPGYSGVDNTLYHRKNVTLLLGDAKETLTRLAGAL